MPHLLLSLLILLSLMACSRHVPDSRLSSLEQLAESDPKAAYDSLAKISAKSLSEEDRHYRDFLSVKISDKAYLAHESDSLVKRVIDYEESHQENGRYAEALYYGGRVYSDLGDYPLALDYYQDALELVPPRKKNLELRSRVVSQTGRLLNSLRLYNEAIPYVKESIEISRHFKDTLNEVYDLQLLASIYLRSGNYTAADSCLNIAISKKSNVPASVNALTNSALASIRLYQGKPREALTLIREAVDSVKPISKSATIARATRIYLANDILDTALIYANELIKSPILQYKKAGYETLFSEPIQKVIGPENTLQHISSYQEVLEDYFNDNNRFLTITQRSSFNYQNYVRNQKVIENKNRYLTIGIFILLILFLISVVIILMRKNYLKNIIVKLQTKLNYFSYLENNLINDVSTISDDYVLSDNGNDQISRDTQACVSLEGHIKSNKPKTTIKNLREQIRDKVNNLYLTNKDNIIISEVILQSQVYQDLQSYISRDIIIEGKIKFWEELEKVVLQASPNFKNNLQLLTNGTLTSGELQTALLIKCGIKPTVIPKLLNRSRGAIISRRDSLSKKIFGEKKEAKVITGIIMLL